MADLFAGIDGECAVSVTFYLRPQLQWIPSAWKQWGLKTGASFSDFIAQCIGTRRPAFKRDIENWKSMLPRANIDVRFLIPELLAGGNQAQDIFNLLGLSEKEHHFEAEARNPSLDMSVLHVLSKNSVAIEYVLQRCGRGWDLPYAFHAPQGTRQIFRYDRV